MSDSAIISVVIVNWNTKDLLCACLTSLTTALANEPHEIVVVDNASSDGSAEMVRDHFPEIRLIANSANLLYAEGNNQGIKGTSGKFVWLLNSDTEVEPKTPRILRDVLESEPHIAAVACKLVDPTVPGSPPSHQLSVRSFPTPAALWFEALGLARLFPRSPLFGQYRMTWWDYDSARDVDQPMTSCMMIRRNALDQIGLFDRAFPLYFNDVDLCYRLQHAGWKIRYVPDTQVIHHIGASTRQIRPKAISESHRSLAEFYRKHYSRLYPLWVYLPTIGLIHAGGWLRMAIGKTSAGKRVR